MIIWNHIDILGTVIFRNSIRWKTTSQKTLKCTKTYYMVGFDRFCRSCRFFCGESFEARTPASPVLSPASRNLSKACSPKPIAPWAQHSYRQAPPWQSSWLGQVGRTSAALPPVDTGMCLKETMERMGGNAGSWKNWNNLCISIYIHYVCVYIFALYHVYII